MASYLITTDQGDTLELEHHGVKGMKWGVRKERPRSDRQVARQNWKETKRVAKRLNQLDKARAIDYGKLSTSMAANANATKAYKKAKAKGNAKKMAKTTERINQSAADIKATEKRIEGYTKEAGRLGKSIANNGYHIKVSRTTRSTMTKGEKAANAAMVILQSMSPSPVVYYRDPRVAGDKYTATKKKATMRGQEYLHLKDGKIDMVR